MAGDTKRCHLRKLEFGSLRYIILLLTIKKPQPQGLEPGDGEHLNLTGSTSTIKARKHQIWCHRPIEGGKLRPKTTRSGGWAESPLIGAFAGQ